jgi:hypothetical protein
MPCKPPYPLREPTARSLKSNASYRFDYLRPTSA